MTIFGLHTELNSRCDLGGWRTTASFFVVSVLLFACSVKGQAGNFSLVKNGGFEATTDTVSGNNQIHLAQGWVEAGPGCMGGTADLFSTQSTYYPMTLPVPMFGCATGHTGNVAGVILYLEQPCTDERDLLSGTLTQPLEAGQLYHFSMRVKLAPRSTWAAIPSIKLHGQAHPSTVELTGNEAARMDYPLTDTGWAYWQGSFIAPHTATGFTIGNHRDDAATYRVRVGSTDSTEAASMGVPFMPHGFPVAYMYVDDVCISRFPWGCGATGPVTIEEEQQNQTPSKEGPAKYYDLLGREVRGDAEGIVIKSGGTSNRITFISK